MSAEAAARFFLRLSFLIFIMAGAASASEIDAPAIHNVRFRQAGHDILIVEVDGHFLPLPTLEQGEGAVLLRWDGCSGEKLLRQAGRSATPELPLAQRVRFHDGENGFAMEVFGEKMLMLKAVRGMSGADRLSIELQPKSQSESVRQKTNFKTGYEEIHNEPVTLELRDMPAYDAFRILASSAGLNLLFDPSAQAGKISVSFREAPFQQVFSFLLRSGNLAYGISGNTLVVGSGTFVGKVLGLHVTKAYHIAYADVTKAAKLLQMLVRLPETPIADERMRQIYVTGTEAQHREAEIVIDRIDHPGKQVMLEARLVEVNKDAKEELETLITAVYKGWIFSSGQHGGSAEYTYANEENSGKSLRVPGLENEITTQIVDPALKMLDAGLRALETKKRGKILASPSVMALDGEKAVIKLTRNYLYQSSVDDKGNAKFSEQETGPTLEITPFIGRDGYITMNLNISSGEVIGFHKSGVSEAPETTKRELETRIRVRDGELFVIGGLYQETLSKSVTRVPVLGYVPLLGELFTNKQSKNVKSEMAFIVIPHIIDIPYSGVETLDVRTGAGFAVTEVF